MAEHVVSGIDKDSGRATRGVRVHLGLRGLPEAIDETGRHIVQAGGYVFGQGERSGDIVVIEVGFFAQQRADPEVAEGTRKNTVRAAQLTRSAIRGGCFEARK